MAGVQFPSHCSLISHSKELPGISSMSLWLAGSSSCLPTAVKTAFPGSSRSTHPPEGSRALGKVIYTSKGMDTSIVVQKLGD